MAAQGYFVKFFMTPSIVVVSFVLKIWVSFSVPAHPRGSRCRNCSTHPSAAYHIESPQLSLFGRKLAESSRNSKATAIL